MNILMAFALALSLAAGMHFHGASYDESKAHKSEIREEANTSASVKASADVRKDEAKDEEKNDSVELKLDIK